MSLKSIKLTKEWFSNNNLKICNICLQFLGREGKCNVPKLRFKTREKICKISLHFLGREREYEEYNDGIRNERKRETEVGNCFAGNPSPNPKPSPKIRKEKSHTFLPSVSVNNEEFNVEHKWIRIDKCSKEVQEGSTYQVDSLEESNRTAILPKSHKVSYPNVKRATGNDGINKNKDCNQNAEGGGSCHCEDKKNNTTGHLG